MIFLDLDGTLIDPKPGITGSVRYALQKLGLPVPAADDLHWVIGPALVDSFARLGAPDVEQALAFYRERYGTTGIFECKLYPGISRALSDLTQSGADLSLATAKPHVYATRITAHFGLDRVLRHQFGPELDGTRNDKAELLAHACKMNGIDPGSSIMVGDRHMDISAGRANGMRTVFVRWGYGSDAEAEGADVICDRPDLLPGAIAAL